jgi:putative polyhydroxyalkanoate system protein
VTTRACLAAAVPGEEGGATVSEIHIKRSHALSHDKARDAAERVAIKLYEDYGLGFEWQDDRIHFSTTGVQGTLHVMPKTVELNAQLGFLLSLLRSQIETEIDSYFDEYFGPPKVAAKAKRPARKREA